MYGEYSAVTVAALGGADYAAQLFKNELALRNIAAASENPLAVTLCRDENFKSNDEYIIELDGNNLTVKALTVRGLIFGYSLLLRKSEIRGGKLVLLKNISGHYKPYKAIRGHQVGYRTTPNTYDAWDCDQYFRCYLDLMAFGANTCEHIPYEDGVSKRNVLMKYDEEDLLREASRLADTVDMDVSLWHPNSDNETAEQAVARRDKLYASLKRVDYVFPPGGDPGELYADDFIDRCKKISEVLKKHHPNAKMTPSAQAPHIYPDWGEALCEELKSEPDELDIFIMGPNHAFPMHELRKRIPAKYPLRFYPDITHNVRCEYPVNFLDDDWHFSYASALSRESVNPRPREFKKLHRIFSPYTMGSVSYSEGVHDDLNKAVWSALEFDPAEPLDEIVRDYARFFMPGADAQKICDGIFGLEDNWQTDPLESPSAKNTYLLFCEILKENPELSENWHFLLLYFRACCDMIVFTRRRFEEALCAECREYMRLGEYGKAAAVLDAPFSESYNALRAEIDTLAAKLFELIGIQLDVEHYHTNSWERGATLDTIDNNVSDRAYYKKQLARLETMSEAEQKAFAQMVLNRCNAGENGIYYSVALHGLDTLGVHQNGEFYMDFQGDRPNAKQNALPMCMTKVFDNFSFRANFGTLEQGCDYKMRIAYKSSKLDVIKHHKVAVNGHTIYDGVQYGGEKDEKFDELMLAPGFESATYDIPAEYLVNGTVELEISEPLAGFEISELWIYKSI